MTLWKRIANVWLVRRKQKNRRRKSVQRTFHQYFGGLEQYEERVPMDAGLSAGITSAHVALVAGEGEGENNSPVLTSDPNVTANATPNQEIDVHIVAHDPDGDTLYFTITSTSFPEGQGSAQIDANGLLNVTAPNAVDSYAIGVGISDGEGPDGTIDPTPDIYVRVGVDVVQSGTENPGTENPETENPPPTSTLFAAYWLDVNGDGHVTPVPDVIMVINWLNEHGSTPADPRPSIQNPIPDPVPEPVNAAPTAQDVQETIASGGSYILNVLAVSNDSNCQTVNIAGFTQGENGTVVADGNGVIRYTPNPEYSGVDHFTYRVTDGIIDTPVAATVTITVLPSGQSPNPDPNPGENTPTLITNGDDLNLNVQKGKFGEIQLNTSDAEGDAPIFNFVFDVQPSTLGVAEISNTGLFKFTAAQVVGTASVVIGARDVHSAAPTDHVRIMLNVSEEDPGTTPDPGNGNGNENPDTNLPPVLTSNSEMHENIGADGSATFTIVASDPEGQPVQIRLLGEVAGVTLSQNIVTVTGRGVTEQITAGFVVTDGVERENNPTGRITVDVSETTQNNGDENNNGNQSQNNNSGTGENVEPVLVGESQRTVAVGKDEVEIVFEFIDTDALEFTLPDTFKPTKGTATLTKDGNKAIIRFVRTSNEAFLDVLSFTYSDLRGENGTDPDGYPRVWFDMEALPEGEAAHDEVFANIDDLLEA